MEAQQVARRYARGLYSLTEERDCTSLVGEDLKSLREILSNDMSLIDFLAAPQVVDEDKTKVVETIFAGKVEVEVYNLMRLLVQRHRTDFLVEIAEEYDRLLMAGMGTVKTRLVSAIPLTNEELGSIRTRLAKLTGKTIELETEVDAEIIGGVIAFVGDKIIDRSVRYGLQQLKEELLKLKVH